MRITVAMKLMMMKSKMKNKKKNKMKLHHSKENMKNWMTATRVSAKLTLMMNLQIRTI